MTVLVGRGTSEKVTLESSFTTIEELTPFTRLRPSSEPNGPNESRSATMRLAKAGPTYLRDSISFSVATSRSRRPTRLGGAFCFFSRLGFRNPDFRAESAAAICRSSAERERESAGERLCNASKARAEAPRTRTVEKNRSALRSAGVGIANHRPSQRLVPHRSGAGQRVLFRGRDRYRVTNAVATSPTMPRDRAETLSIVSCGVWCGG
jgi:hypothetical protein